MKQFNRFRNHLNTQLRCSKIHYYQHVCRHITRQRPDVAWKTINDVLGRKTNRSAVEMLTVGNPELIGKELVDYLNNHFVNTNLTDNCPPDISIHNSSYIHSIFLEPTDEYEIHNTFMILRNNESLDIDNIQI